MRFTVRSTIIGTMAVAMSAAALAPGASAGSRLTYQGVRPNPDEQTTPAGPVGPPILRVARASGLSAVNRVETQRQAARSYSPPASARYSSAEADAYLGPPGERVSASSSAARFAGPGAPPILRVARASELAAIDRVEVRREAALSYRPSAGTRYGSAVLDAYATLAGPPVAASAPTVKVPGVGFDFGAAAVGAGLAVTIMVLIAAGALVVRRRRQPQYG